MWMHMCACDILYLKISERNLCLSHRKISLTWKIAKLRQLLLVTEVSEFFSVSKTKHFVYTERYFNPVILCLLEETENFGKKFLSQAVLILFFRSICNPKVLTRRALILTLT